jgi:hypothetical protein
MKARRLGYKSSGVLAQRRCLTSDCISNTSLHFVTQFRQLMLQSHAFQVRDNPGLDCDQQIATHARSSDVARRAGEVLGVGPVTSSALAATTPDAKVFRNGRQFVMTAE